MEQNSPAPDVIVGKRQLLTKYLPIIIPVGLALIFVIILLLSRFISLPFLQFQSPYPLEINGEKIGRKVFDNQLKYTQTILGVTDEKQAKDRVNDTFITRKILRDEAETRGIVITDEEINQNATSPNVATLPEYREAVKDKLIEDKLKPLVVAERDVELLVVAFGYDHPELSGLNQKQLALSKIQSARDKLVAGRPIKEVATAMESDGQIQALNRGGVVYLEFPKTNAGKSIITGELTDALFNLTSPGVPTEPILLKGVPAEWGRPSDLSEFGWAVGVVSKISEGGSLTFDSWLKEQKDKLDINFQGRL